MWLRMLARTTFLVLLFLSQVHRSSDADDGQTDLDKLVAELREKKPRLSEEFEKRLAQSRKEVENYKRGSVVFGQVELEEGKDARAVTSQMIVLEDGYFVDAIGAIGNPFGFRLHGYEAVDVTPKESGSVENLGVIRMKRLPDDQLASVSGRLRFEGAKDETVAEKIQVTWNITGYPINTPHNGTEGTTGFHKSVISEVAKDGTFTASGMSNGKYNLYVAVPGFVKQLQTVEFQKAESKELPPILLERVRKVNVEFAVSKECDFNDATFKKTVLKADDRWRANDEVPEYAWDLALSQKNGKLLLRYSYAPCHIVDLGAHELDDELTVNDNELARTHAQNVPVEEGHVYLVHQASWKHWILFRTTFDSDEAEKSPSEKPHQ